MKTSDVLMAEAKDYADGALRGTRYERDEDVKFHVRCAWYASRIALLGEQTLERHAQRAVEVV